MKKTISIKGMHCKSCVMLLTDAVSELPGVNKVDVSLEKNNATIDFDEKKVNEKQIKDTIVKEGYKV